MFKPNYNNNFIISFNYIQITLYDSIIQTSFSVFLLRNVNDVSKRTDITFSVSSRLFQPMGKTEFSSIAENRTNSVS